MKLFHFPLVLIILSTGCSVSMTKAGTAPYALTVDYEAQRQAVRAKYAEATTGEQADMRAAELAAVDQREQAERDDLARRLTKQNRDVEKNAMAGSLIVGGIGH